jgi:hypothetical protein
MKIVSVINAARRDVIDRILDHGGVALRAAPTEARTPDAGVPAQSRGRPSYSPVRVSRNRAIFLTCSASRSIPHW